MKCEEPAFISCRAKLPSVHVDLFVVGTYLYHVLLRANRADQKSNGKLSFTLNILSELGSDLE